MVIDGAPLYGIVSLEPVRLRSVVVVELKDVVQSQRHHVVDAGFATFQHELRHGRNKLLVSGEGLSQPFLGNGF